MELYVRPPPGMQPLELEVFSDMIKYACGKGPEWFLLTSKKQ